MAVLYKIKKLIFLATVPPLIISAPQKCVIPKEKAILCLFSFGITHFWGADIIRGDTVFETVHNVQSLRDSSCTF